MIWIGITLYLAIGVVLTSISVASVHNFKPRLTRQCILNTLRWMDVEAWLIAIFYAIFWFPILLVAGILKLLS